MSPLAHAGGLEVYVPLVALAVFAVVYRLIRGNDEERDPEPEDDA